MSEVDPNAVPGDAPAVAPDPVAPDPVVDVTDPVVASATTVTDGTVTPATTEAATDVPGDAPVSPPAATDVPTAADPSSDSPIVTNAGVLVTNVDPAAANADVAATNVDIGVTPTVPAVEQSAPSNESATDPTADPIVPVVAEAQPDTPPTDNPDVYAQNLAANVAGSPVAPVDPVVQSDDVDPRYALRTEAQLSDLEAASSLLLNAVRALCVAGLTRGQLRDSCVLAIDQLYVERNDAQAAGNADPYPTY